MCPTVRQSEIHLSDYTSQKAKYGGGLVFLYRKNTESLLGDFTLFSLPMERVTCCKKKAIKQVESLYCVSHVLEGCFSSFPDGTCVLSVSIACVGN